MTARELLQHRFIRNARRPGHLVELVQRYETWKAKQKSSRSKSSPSKTLARQAGGFDANTLNGSGTVRSEWNFDETIRGTVKGVPVNLDLDDMEEEDEEEWDYQNEPFEIWDGTTRVRGDSVLGEAMGSRNVCRGTESE